MAHSKSALKRVRQSLKRRDRNRARRSLARNSVRELREAVDGGKTDEVPAALSAAYSALDTAAKQSAIPTRRADRTKRRLASLAARSGAAS